MSIDVAVVDGEVLCCIDSVVIGIDGDLSSANFYSILTLNPLTVASCCCDIYCAACDDDASAIGVGIAALGLQTSLYSFRRRIVVAIHIVGIAGIVGIFCCAVVVIQSSGGLYCYFTVCYCQEAVTLYSLAARTRCSRCYCASTDVYIAICTDAASRFRLQIVGIPCAATCGSDVEGAACDIDVTGTLNAFGSCCGTVNGDFATRDVEVTCILILVFCCLAS